MTTRQRRGKNGLPTGVASAAPQKTTQLQTKIEEQKETGTMLSPAAGSADWIALAIASGACAAINGVFAKLTTTSLTSNLAIQLSTALGFGQESSPINMILRGTFFGLNLLFNGIMWTLFTKALTKGSSTTRVSIINVSANFFVTAMLGWAIFGEKLPLKWWMGAGLLAAGNVVIGKREEDEKKADMDGGEQGLVRPEQENQEDLIEFSEPNSNLTKAGFVQVKLTERVK